MKKLAAIAVILFLVAFDGVSQDIFKINFGLDPNERILPQKVIGWGSDRYLIYARERSNFQNIGYTVGLMRLNLSNQVMFDTHMEIDEPNVTVVDAELQGNNIHILAQGGANHAIFLTINRFHGAVSDNRKITVGLPSVTMTDLNLGDVNGLYGQTRNMCAIGYSAGKIVVLYPSDIFGYLDYKEVIFDNPAVTSYQDLKFDWITIDEMTGNPNDWSNAIQVSGIANPLTGGFRFRFSPVANTIFDAASININNSYFSNFKSFCLDGLKHILYYGQLKNGNVTSQNGDIFLVSGYYGGGWPEQIWGTYNNPYFHMVNGIDDPGYSIGLNKWVSFSGYYFEQSDLLHPLYAMGVLDGFGYGVSANTYSLRIPYTPGTISPDFKVSTTANYFYGGNRTAFIARSGNAGDYNNAYYIKEGVSTSCNGGIGFSQTYDKSISMTPFDIQYVSSRNRVSLGDLTLTYLGYSSFNNISTVCAERAPDGYYIDPGCNCISLPPAIDAAKAKKQTMLSENNDIQIRVSPNPATNQITINSPEPIKQINLYGGEGRLMLSKNNLNTKQHVLSITSLPSGTYMLNILTVKGQTMVKKIIKL